MSRAHSLPIGLAAGLLAIAATGLAREDPGPATADSTASRVGEQGPYRSRMRIVTEADRPALPADAEVALESLADDAYGRALLLRRLGYADAASGDYASASARFEEALETGGLDPIALAQIRQNLGALYVAEGQFARAVAVYAPLLAGEPPPSVDTLFALAYAYARIDRPTDTLAVLDRALARDGKPRTDWLELKLYAQTQLSRYGDAAVTMQALLSLEPDNESYWRQLAGMYQAAGEPARAVAALLAAEAGGLLSAEQDIERIARAQLAAGTPYEAALRLDGALADRRLSPTAAHYRLAADAWLLAREYEAAVAPLGAAAAESNDPDLYMRLGDLHRELGQWSQASEAYARAARRGGPQAARAWLALGEARYRAGEVSAAADAFRNATRFGGVYRAAAEWLSFLGLGPAAIDTAADPATERAAQASDDADVPDGDRPAVDAPPTTAESATSDSSLRVATANADAAGNTLDFKQVAAGRYYLTTETVALQTAQARALRLARDLRTAVTRQRIAVDGPLHLFLNQPSDGTGELSLSVGVPVRSTAPPSGDFRARRLAGFACAYTIYEGTWDGLPAAWRDFEERVTASGLDRTGERRQIIHQRGRADGSGSRVELQIGLVPRADAS